MQHCPSFAMPVPGEGWSQVCSQCCIPAQWHCRGPWPELGADEEEEGPSNKRASKQENRQNSQQHAVAVHSTVHMGRGAA